MKKSIFAIAMLVVGLFMQALESRAQLITHHDPLYMPSFSKPAVGVPYTDPVFNTTVRRLTNAQLSGYAGIIPQYSKRQAWNANDSLMLLYNGNDGYFSLYDGQTYQFIRDLDDPYYVYGDDVFWHPLFNNVIIYVPGNTIYSYDLTTEVRTEIHSFPSYEWANSMGEGHLSYNGRYYAFVGRTYDTVTYQTTEKDIVVFDFETNSVVSILALPADTLMGDFDWVSISPLGNYVVIEFADNEPGRYHGVEVYDRNLNFLRRLGSGSGHKQKK